MNNYRTGRFIASIVGAAGWVVVAIGFFFFVFRLVRTDIAFWGSAAPLLMLALGGLSLVLLGLVARAVFDIASARK